MINTKFEAYKIRREIKKSGKKFDIERKETNEFGEPIGLIKIVGSFNGLYHEQNSNISVTTGETTQTRSKKIPSILCLFDDIRNLNADVGDYIKFNEKTFIITGMVNVQEWNVISDISLEVVDDGKF